MYENTPSAKDISQKLDYFSLWIKMFWNGWYGFIVAYDIIAVIDGKQKTEYSTYKAGKDLRNSSLVCPSHQRGGWKSRQHPGHVLCCQPGRGPVRTGTQVSRLQGLSQQPSLFTFLPKFSKPSFAAFIWLFTCSYNAMIFSAWKYSLLPYYHVFYPLFTLVIPSPVSPLDAPWCAICS